MGATAIAGTAVPTTGHGYGATTSSTATPLADGSTLIKRTTHEVWIQGPSEANFPAEVIADCSSAMLLSAEGAPLAFSGVCSGTDIDGDTFIAANHSMTPDFSDCQWSMYGGTGKYAGVTGGGICIPAAQPLVMAVTASFPGKGNGSCHKREAARLFSGVNGKSGLQDLRRSVCQH